MSWQRAGEGPVRPADGQAGTLASDADRDAAAGVLSEAFADGRLTADEHGVRVRAAYAARSWQQLGRLTADLPAPAPSPAMPATGMAAGADKCLLCALLIACPRAGIAWLLVSRHRARACGGSTGTAAGHDRHWPRGR